MPYVLQGQGEPSSGWLGHGIRIITRYYIHDYMLGRVETRVDIWRASGYPPGYPSLCVFARGQSPMTEAQWRWMARMGTPWRQWPAAYGKGNSVYRR